jgi:hypothetical protein
VDYLTSQRRRNVRQGSKHAIADVQSIASSAPSFFPIAEEEAFTFSQPSGLSS